MEQRSEGKLFGVIAIGLGMITKEQLEECLRIQKQESGERPLIGAIMLDKGYLTESQIKEILYIQYQDE